jgi:hypothetical protein
MRHQPEQFLQYQATQQVDIPQNLFDTDGDAEGLSQDGSIGGKSQGGMKDGD